VYPAFYALMLRASKDAPPGNERGREGGLRRREAGGLPRQLERERGGRPPQARVGAYTCTTRTACKCIGKDERERGQARAGICQGDAVQVYTPGCTLIHTRLYAYTDQAARLYRPGCTLTQTGLYAYTASCRAKGYRQAPTGDAVWWETRTPPGSRGTPPGSMSIRSLCCRPEAAEAMLYTSQLYAYTAVHVTRALYGYI
jgi:hypothetical protein